MMKIRGIRAKAPLFLRNSVKVLNAHVRLPLAGVYPVPIVYHGRKKHPLRKLTQPVFS
jgi:hypothetical protein